MKKRTKHRVYNYVGEKKNGTWIRRSIRVEFDDLKDFFEYMIDKKKLEIFGITKSGLFIVSDKAKQLII